MQPTHIRGKWMCVWEKIRPWKTERIKLAETSATKTAHDVSYKPVKPKQNGASYKFVIIHACLPLTSWLILVKFSEAEERRFCKLLHTPAECGTCKIWC